MKKKINNFSYYSRIINEIEKVRKKNNKNWMDILRVGFKYNPSLSKKIVRQIFNDDEITKRKKLLRKYLKITMFVETRFQKRIIWRR